MGSKPWTSHVTPGKSLRESLTQDALQEVVALQMLLCTRTYKYGRHLRRRSLHSRLADSWIRFQSWSSGYQRDPRNSIILIRIDSFQDNWELQHGFLFVGQCPPIEICLTGYMFSWKRYRLTNHLLQDLQSRPHTWASLSGVPRWFIWSHQFCWSLLHHLPEQRLPPGTYVPSGSNPGILGSWVQTLGTDRLRFAAGLLSSDSVHL